MRAAWRTASVAKSINNIHGFRQCKRCISDGPVFKDGDHVLFRKADDPTGHVFLRQLRGDKKVETHNGSFAHNDAIGKRLLDTVTTTKKITYRLHQPTLAEYVRLTPRLVTPIYPQDANLIVSLLDLHPDPEAPSEATDTIKPIEILECGTGHGGLTLHLARAIHAANVNLTPSDPAADTSAKRQNAIIHSVDVSKKHSKHAAEVVHGFRRGLYANNVSFHVGTVPEFLEQHRAQVSSSDDGQVPITPFLSHAILDLPGADRVLAQTAEALRTDGKLLVFAPSVTQIMDCVALIKEARLPLALVQCLELGGGISGGREWNVKMTKIRNVERERSREKKEKKEADHEVDRENSDTGVEPGADNGGRSDAAVASRRDTVDTEDTKLWGMICRPKVGEMVVGGGFVAMWSKKRIDGDTLEQ